MTKKPTYEELERSEKELEKENIALKQSGRLLQQSEQNLRELLSVSPVIIYRCETEGKFPATFITENIRNHLGYEPHEFTENPDFWASHIHPDDAPHVFSNLTNLFERGYHIHEYRFLHKDGTYRWMNDELRLIYDVGDKPTDIVGNMTDITERKRMEEVLRKSEDKYRSLANNLNVGIYRNSAGLKGKCIEANPAIVDMFGFDTKEEFLNVRVSELYKYPADRNKYNAKIVKKGEVRNEELQLRKNDGTSFIGSVSAVAVKDEKGDVKYYDGIIEDITERKLAEASRREVEEKYRTVLEANPDPVVLYDIEGRVVYFNPAFTRVFGWRLEERLGEKMDIFVPKEAWRETKMMIDKVLAGERFSSIETIRYNKAGKIIPVSVSGAIYKDQKGNPIGSVINLRDISYHKKMEAKLQQAQKMEAIGTLAGGIAHDFNNILSPLLGFSEMLRDDLPPDSPLQSHVDEILHAALRSRNLVRQILAFSRKGDQDLRPIKLHPTVKEAIQLLQSSIPATIDIQQDLDPGCGVVIADSTQVHQVIMNLATNAYHAMEETGGRLNVTLQQVRLDSDQALFPELVPGEYALLAVTDTGTGIAKDNLDKIFDPYFTTKEADKGTGLGLSVVQGIVKSCSGYIHINSESGKGTEIQVYLPIMKRTVEDVQVDRSEPFQGGNENILLVDDEEVIVRMEQQMLERLGYRVTIRTGSVDALEAFKANPDTFDLVVTDMTMPNMTGVQLAGQIKKIRPDIPVILCTGFSHQVDAEKSKALGIEGFVMKPVIMKEIGKVIRKVLDNVEG